MTTSLTNLVPVSLIEELLCIGMNCGGDFAEIYIERSRGNSIALEEKKIRTAAYGVSMGVGIRVIAGTEVGYAYSDDLEPAALKKAASVAAAIAQGGGSPGPIEVGQRERPNRYHVDVEPDSISPAAKVALLKTGDDAAHAFDARITQVMGSFVDQTRDILIATSKGDYTEDHQIMCRINFTTIAQDANGDRRTGFHGGGGRVGFDYYEKFSPELVARESARMAVAQFGAVAAPARRRWRAGR